MWYFAVDLDTATALGVGERERERQLPFVRKTQKAGDVFFSPFFCMKSPSFLWKQEAFSLGEKERCEGCV